MELETALAYIQGRGSIHYVEGVRQPVDIWSSEKLPIQVRRTIRQNREQVLQLMHAGDIRTCSSPTLHKKSWRRQRGQDIRICMICRQLELYMEGR